MSVSADQAQGTGLDFDNSRWVFRGNVKVSMDQGQLTSDEAEITFARKLIAKALVNGKAGRIRAAHREDRQAGAGAGRKTSTTM